MTAWKAEGIRFILFGAFNTFFTYAIYCVMVFWLHPQVAYALVFALGILIAYWGNSAFVFRVEMRWRLLAPFFLLYLGTYAANALLLYLFTTYLGIGPRLSLIVALFFVTPVTFLLNRTLLTRYSRSSRST